jgi:hypothetical protein
MIDDSRFTSPGIPNGSDATHDDMVDALNDQIVKEV